MAPALEGLIGVAVGILLRPLLLSKMALVIGGDLPHMGYIVLIIFGWIILRILTENFNNPCHYRET